MSSTKTRRQLLEWRRMVSCEPESLRGNGPRGHALGTSGRNSNATYSWIVPRVSPFSRQSSVPYAGKKTIEGCAVSEEAWSRYRGKTKDRHGVQESSSERAPSTYEPRGVDQGPGARVNCFGVAQPDAPLWGPNR